MATVKAFRAVRPKPEHAAEVASLPYDVMNTEEARQMAAGNPCSFLRISRSELELDDSVDPYSPQVYERARTNFEKLLHDGVLLRETAASVYVYRLVREGREQTGVVALSAVDEYEAGVIRIHEKTRPEKEADRLQHMLTTGAQTGPVFLAFRDPGGIAALLSSETENPPLYDFTAPDYVRHTVWRAQHGQALAAAMERVPNTYVADGHHRAASACRCRRELRGKNPNHTGSEAYNFFLSVLFPHDQLQIMPYNRIVRRLPGDPAQLLAELRRVFAVSEAAPPSPEQPGHVSMYMGGSWYGLAPLPGDSRPADPVDALDVSVLYNRALKPIFGIGDQRTDHNIDYIGGIRGTAELQRLVDNGQAGCAFSMFPVSIEELLRVADQGKTMAPKSTWFEPKLRSGLLVHQFAAGW